MTCRRCARAANSSDLDHQLGPFNVGGVVSISVEADHRLTYAWRQDNPCLMPRPSAKDVDGPATIAYAGCVEAGRRGEDRDGA